MNGTGTTAPPGGRLGETLHTSTAAAWGRDREVFRRANLRARRWAAGAVAAVLVAAGVAAAGGLVVYFGGRGAPFAVTAGTSLLCGGSLVALGWTAAQCPDEVWRGLRVAGRGAWLAAVLAAIYAASEAVR